MLGRAKLALVGDKKCETTQSRVKLFISFDVQWLLSAPHIGTCHMDLSDFNTHVVTWCVPLHIGDQLFDQVAEGFRKEKQGCPSNQDK